MISKALKADSFYHTCRYVCQKKGAEVLLADGVRSHDFRLMAEDFTRQQASRPGKEKAGVHLILSFHPDEKPSDDLMKEIAWEYLKRLGITDTQVAIIKHTDTNHPHLHIVLNLVDNAGNAISDSWIGLRGKKIAQDLTQKYQLIPAIRKNVNLAKLESMNASEAAKAEIYEVISATLPRCQTLAELEFHLRIKGIETKYKYKGQTQEKQGISFKKGNLCFKGSEIDRGFSLGNLQKTLAIPKNQRLKTKPQTAANRSSLPSDSSRIKTVPRQAQRTSKPDSKDFQSESIISKMIVELLMPVHTPGYSAPAPDPRKKKKKRRHL